MEVGSKETESIEKPTPAQPKPPEPDLEEIRNVVFEPNPGPQTQFLAAPEQEVLYGGAAGGGKSYAMLVDPLRQMTNPKARGILFRRTNDELKELKAISKELYPQAIPGAKWAEKDSHWTFPSGATLWMTYLDRDDDVTRYQGQAFSWIGFDELTQWPSPYPWDYMRSRLRTTGASGLTLYQRATTNPGGIGHQWVKKMFVDPAPPGQSFWATDLETGKPLICPANHPRAGEPLLKRRFIPAKLKDNPYLAEDGMYEANLLTLPEQQRKQLLEGDWDVAEGAAFSEWNREIHVIEPFKIPNSWTKFRAADYGYNDPSAVLWFAVAPTGQLIVYRELYGKGYRTDQLAAAIAEVEEDDKISYAVLDSSVWQLRGQDRGDSLGDQINNRLRAYGCKAFRPSDRSKGSRVAGKNEIHKRLQEVIEDQNQAMLVFFNTCTECISQIPSVPLDKKNPEDVDTKSEDHIYDALRYGVATKPLRAEWGEPVRLTAGFQASDSVFGY